MTDKPRGRPSKADPAAVIAMVQSSPAMSYVAIGREFGISGVAVHKKIKKHATDLLRGKGYNRRRVEA